LGLEQAPVSGGNCTEAIQVTAEAGQQAKEGFWDNLFRIHKFDP
jgi:hypothetical protein